MLKYTQRKTYTKLVNLKAKMLKLYHRWYTPNQPMFQASPINSPIVSDAESDNSDAAVEFAEVVLEQV